MENRKKENDEHRRNTEAALRHALTAAPRLLKIQVNPSLPQDSAVHDAGLRQRQVQIRGAVHQAHLLRGLAVLGVLTVLVDDDVLWQLYRIAEAAHVDTHAAAAGFVRAAILSALLVLGKAKLRAIVCLLLPQPHQVPQRRVLRHADLDHEVHGVDRRGAAPADGASAFDVGIALLLRNVVQGESARIRL